MKFKRFIWAVVCLLAVNGCSPENNGNAVVSFDGGVLTIEDLRAHLDRLKRNPQYQQHPERLNPEFAYEHAVNMELIIAKALNEKLHQDPEIRAEIHEFMADLFLKVMQDKLVPKIDRDSFTDDEVRAYFDEHKDSYRTPDQYGVRVIL
ncbi:MAG: peptidyl-prolyl cis-trans isomerase, partial [Clostridia bacterium]|nr:peptidyl-prolyl cis-trans isomerase [Clostridia bacterium]